jgi:hypothetical protein
MGDLDNYSESLEEFMGNCTDEEWDDLADSVEDQDANGDLPD